MIGREQASGRYFYIFRPSYIIQAGDFYKSPKDRLKYEEVFALWKNAWIENTLYSTLTSNYYKWIIHKKEKEREMPEWQKLFLN